MESQYTMIFVSIEMRLRRCRVDVFFFIIFSIFFTSSLRFLLLIAYSIALKGCPGLFLLSCFHLKIFDYRSSGILSKRPKHFWLLCSTLFLVDNDFCIQMLLLRLEQSNFTAVSLLFVAFFMDHTSQHTTYSTTVCPTTHYLSIKLSCSTESYFQFFL